MAKLGSALLAAALLPCGDTHAQEPRPTASPIQLTLTGHLEAPLDPAVERATHSVGEQIDAKRAAKAAHSPLWDLAIWRFLPTSPGRTLNSPVASDDDPFFTPSYLKVSARQMNDQVKKTERNSRELLR